MCAKAARNGTFARPRPFAERSPADPGAAAAMVLGRSVSAAMMMVVPAPQELGNTLLAVGTGSGARSSRMLPRVAGHPLRAVIDSRDRVCVLSQSQPNGDARRPLTLTVAR
jgi:hypothetical protein